MPLIAGERADSVGGYALERPVSVGVRESTWLATDRTGSPCVVEIWERFDTGADSGGDLDAFVERAALQRRIASASGGGSGLGGGHVVPVHAIEATDFGAFLARDRYAVSASELVGGKTRLRADALQEIVSGVVGALLVFRERAGRPHGALDLASVLLDGGAAGKQRVGLRMPATGLELAAIGDVDSDELRRLGLLIFELVLHRPFRAMGGYPVRDGTEWQALGKAGPFWLGLVNELLNPSGCRLTLGEVASRIASLRFKVDGPGPLVWLGRVGVAAAVLAVVGAGAWYVVRPRDEPSRAAFRIEEFERWLRMTPVVESLREEAKEAGAPAVLVEAAGRLEDAEPGGNDPFDVLQVIERVGLDSAMRVGLDTGLDELIEAARRIEADDLAARAASQAEDSERKRELEELAFIYRVGLARFGIDLPPPVDTKASVEGDGGGDTASAAVNDASLDVNSLLDAFSVETWPARGVVGGLVEGGGAAWFRPSASALFAAQVEGVRDGLEAIEAGAGEGMGFGSATIGSPATEEIRGVVDRFVGSVEAIERAAGVVGVWSEEIYPDIASGSEVLVGASAWPALPGNVSADLRVERDLYLASFDDFASGVGVVTPGETDEDLDRRLRAAADAVNAAKAIVERGWNAESVDFLTHAAWVRSARERLEARPSADDGAELASWIDARIGLADEWVSSVERAAPVPEGEPWPVADLGDALREARTLWSEAAGEEPEETRLVEIEITGSAGVVEPALDELVARLGEVRALPRWESLRGRVDAVSRELERDAEKWIATVEQIHAEVLQSPREVIAFWRENPIRVEGFAGAADLQQIGLDLHDRYSVAWETYAANSGLEDEALKGTPESDVLVDAMQAVGEVVSQAAEEIRAAVAADRSYGGYDGDEVRAAIGAWLSSRFVDEIRTFDGWDDKARAKPGGAFVTALESLARSSAEELDRVSGDLDRLAGSAGLVARGYAVGDQAGGVSVGDRGSISSLVARLRADASPRVDSIDRVNRALAAVDALVGVGDVDTPDRLVGMFAAESGAEGRAGIGVEALRRLDALRAEGRWPGSVDGMLSDRDDLVAGVSTLRSGIPADDFATRSGELQEIVQGWWRTGVASAGDRGEFVRAVDGASDWFAGLGEGWAGLLSEDLLEGRARYNMLLVDLRGQIASQARTAIGLAADPNVDDSAIAAIDRELLESVRGVLKQIEEIADDRLGDGERARSLGWVREFRAELNEAEGGKRGWDEDKVGPVGMRIDNWTATLDESVDPARVIYSYNPRNSSEAVSIEFRLVDNLPDQGKVFLSTDEVSIAVFSAMLRGVGPDMTERLESTLFQMVGGKFEGNLVPGPASRVFLPGRGSRNPFRVSEREHWLDADDGRYGPPVQKASYPSYPKGMRGAGPKDIEPSQGEPEMAHPVNYLNAGVVLDMVDAFGFRLPTVDEYRSAAGRVPDVRSGRWNLRDASFGAQQVHQRSAFELEVTTHYKPGQFSYDGTNGENPQDWGLGGADRWLWFCMTGQGAENGFQDGIMFRHLIGNVAEYVIENEGVRNSRGVRVMGASALSDPGVMPRDAVEVGNERNGFVDVGFRLAIDADDFGSLGMLVQRRLKASEDEYFVPGDGG